MPSELQMPKYIPQMVRTAVGQAKAKAVAKEGFKQQMGFRPGFMGEWDKDRD